MRNIDFFFIVMFIFIFVVCFYIIRSYYFTKNSKKFETIIYETTLTRKNMIKIDQKYLLFFFGKNSQKSVVFLVDNTSLKFSNLWFRFLKEPFIHIHTYFYPVFLFVDFVLKRSRYKIYSILFITWVFIFGYLCYKFDLVLLLYKLLLNIGWKNNNYRVLKNLDDCTFFYNKFYGFNNQDYQHLFSYKNNIDTKVANFKSVGKNLYKLPYKLLSFDYLWSSKYVKPDYEGDSELYTGMIRRFFRNDRYLRERRIPYSLALLKRGVLPFVHGFRQDKTKFRFLLLKHFGFLKDEELVFEKYPHLDYMHKYNVYQDFIRYSINSPTYNIKSRYIVQFYNSFIFFCYNHFYSFFDFVRNNNNFFIIDFSYSYFDSLFIKAYLEWFQLLDYYIKILYYDIFNLNSSNYNNLFLLIIYLEKYFLYKSKYFGSISNIEFLVNFDKNQFLYECTKNDFYFIKNLNFYQEFYGKRMDAFEVIYDEERLFSFVMFINDYRTFSFYPVKGIDELNYATNIFEKEKDSILARNKIIHKRWKRFLYWDYNEFEHGLRELLGDYEITAKDILFRNIDVRLATNIFRKNNIKVLSKFILKLYGYNEGNCDLFNCYKNVISFNVMRNYKNNFSNDVYDSGFLETSIIKNVLLLRVYKYKPFNFAKVMRHYPTKDFFSSSGWKSYSNFVSSKLAKSIGSFASVSKNGFFYAWLTSKNRMDLKFWLHHYPWFLYKPFYLREIEYMCVQGLTGQTQYDQMIYRRLQEKYKSSGGLSKFNIQLPPTRYRDLDTCLETDSMMLLKDAKVRAGLFPYPTSAFVKSFYPDPDFVATQVRTARCLSVFHLPPHKYHTFAIGYYKRMFMKMDGYVKATMDINHKDYYNLYNGREVRKVYSFINIKSYFQDLYLLFIFFKDCVNVSVPFLEFFQIDTGKELLNLFNIFKYCYDFTLHYLFKSEFKYIFLHQNDRWLWVKLYLTDSIIEHYSNQFTTHSRLVRGYSTIYIWAPQHLHGVKSVGNRRISIIMYRYMNNSFLYPTSVLYNCGLNKKMEYDYTELARLANIQQRVLGDLQNGIYKEGLAKSSRRHLYGRLGGFTEIEPDYFMMGDEGAFFMDFLYYTLRPAYISIGFFDKIAGNNVHNLMRETIDLAYLRDFIFKDATAQIIDLTAKRSTIIGYGESTEAYYPARDKLKGFFKVKWNNYSKKNIHLFVNSQEFIEQAFNSGFFFSNYYYHLCNSLSGGFLKEIIVLENDDCERNDLYSGRHRIFAHYNDSFFDINASNKQYPLSDVYQRDVYLYDAVPMVGEASIVKNTFNQKFDDIAFLNFLVNNSGWLISLVSGLNGFDNINDLVKKITSFDIKEVFINVSNSSSTFIIDSISNYIKRHGNLELRQFWRDLQFNFFSELGGYTTVGDLLIVNDQTYLNCYTGSFINYQKSDNCFVNPRNLNCLKGLGVINFKFNYNGHLKPKFYKLDLLDLILNQVNLNMSKSDIILKNDLSEFKHLNYYNLVHFTNYIIYKIIIDDLSPDQMMELIEKFSNDFVLLPEDCWFIHRNLIGFFNLLSDKGIHFRLKLYESNGFKNNSANFLSVPSNFFYNFLSIK